MAHPVFISYSRTTSRQDTEALHRELGELAFLDNSDIETGEQFPKILVDALLDAKVAAIFIDKQYFIAGTAEKNWKPRSSRLSSSPNKPHSV